jgi:hypothetical protein
MIEFIPEEVDISSIPADVDTGRLLIEPNKCLANAYFVTRDHPENMFIEGAIILYDRESNSTIMVHAWNKSKNAHFDVNAPLWTSEEHGEVKEIKYLPVRGYEFTEMKQGSLKFSDETNALVTYQKIIITWKFKPEMRVVLLDPLSGKPVNHGVITNYDEAAKCYHVNLNRLNNVFLYAWQEDHITVATPELIEEADNLLLGVEIASDHLLSGLDTKNKPAETVLEIPLSVPPYIVYYIQMNVEGAKKWRLLTLKTHSPAE